MFFLLLLLFFTVPLVELAVIIEVSARIGLSWTLLSLAAVSVIGAALARRQGGAAYSRIRSDVRAGIMPGESLVDGALALSAALLLLAPGYVTDAVGLLLLTPPGRRAVRALVRRRLRAAVRRRITIFRAGDEWRDEPGETPPADADSGPRPEREPPEGLPPGDPPC